MKALAIFLLLFLLSVSSFAAEQNPVVDSEGKPLGSASRSVEISYKFCITDIPEDSHRILAWVPLPIAEEHQKLLGFSVGGDSDYTVVRERQYNNHYLLFSFPGIGPDGNSEIPLEIKFRVSRDAYRVDEPAEEKPPYDERLIERFLSPDRFIPIDGKILDEARGLVGCCDSPLQKARKLYDHIVETVRYDKSGEGWGLGDALRACDVRAGNCTDFHSLFIGEARALGIPARFVMGIALPMGSSSGDIGGYHCWGEFYIADYGWIPIDASEAHKHPERKEAFFGGLDANRVQFTVGRDIKLPRSRSEPLNFSFKPHVEIDGKVHDAVELSLSFSDIAGGE